MRTPHLTPFALDNMRVKEGMREPKHKLACVLCYPTDENKMSSLARKHTVNLT